MKALTIRPAWAWAIVHGRPVEIRSWDTHYRGQLAIHASSSINEADADAELIKVQSGLDVPMDLECGAIMGKARLFGSVKISTIIRRIRKGEGLPDLGLDAAATAHLLPWIVDHKGRGFKGFAWLLDGQQACKPADIPGKLNLWEVPDRLVQPLDLGFVGTLPFWRAGQVQT